MFNWYVYSGERKGEKTVLGANTGKVYSSAGMVDNIGANI